jgi:hypothetical protein
MAASMKMTAFLDIAPSSLVEALKMETCFSETLVSINESAWRHNAEDQYRHLHRLENLKPLTKNPLSKALLNNALVIIFLLQLQKNNLCS